MSCSEVEYKKFNMGGAHIAGQIYVNLPEKSMFFFLQTNPRCFVRQINLCCFARRIHLKFNVQSAPPPLLSSERESSGNSKGKRISEIMKIMISSEKTNRKCTEHVLNLFFWKEQKFI